MHCTRGQGFVCLLQSRHGGIILNRLTIQMFERKLNMLCTRLKAILPLFDCFLPVWLCNGGAVVEQ